MAGNIDGQNFEKLFSPIMVGKKRASNRFAAQAMEGNDADSGGAVSDRAIKRYSRLAQGKWGVVVVEAISITPESRARVNGLVLNDNNLDGFKRLVDSYKRINPEGILLFQVTHAGRKAGPTSRKVALYESGSAGADILSEQEIEDIRGQFIDCVHLSHAAGADGVDFKLCHGYLGSEMLRPANQRDDKWGGSFENRTRFILSSLRELKNSYKDTDFILGSRISMYEGIRGGCGTASPDSIVEDLSEMKRLIALMAKEGSDYLNVSAGIPGETSEITRPTNPTKLFYLHQFRYCKEARETAGGMTIIGSAYSVLKEEALVLGEENLRKGLVDLVGFGRQSFADPLFPAKVQHSESVNYCTACSGCTKLMVNQVNDGCVIFDPYYRDMLKSLSAR